MSLLLLIFYQREKDYSYSKEKMSNMKAKMQCWSLQIMYEPSFLKMTSLYPVYVFVILCVLVLILSFSKHITQVLDILTCIKLLKCMHKNTEIVWSIPSKYFTGSAMAQCPSKCTTIAKQQNLVLSSTILHKKFYHMLKELTSHETLNSAYSFKPIYCSLCFYVLFIIIYNWIWE